MAMKKALFGAVVMFGYSGAFDLPMTMTFSDGSVAPVPIPAALPLLASGLGALGFIGWRRKRQALAAA